MHEKISGYKVHKEKISVLAVLREIIKGIQIKQDFEILEIKLKFLNESFSIIPTFRDENDDLWNLEI